MNVKQYPSLTTVAVPGEQQAWSDSLPRLEIKSLSFHFMKQMFVL